METIDPHHNTQITEETINVEEWSKCVNIISDLFIEYKANHFITQKIQSYISKLPNVLQKDVEKQDEKERKKKERREEMERKKKERKKEIAK